MYMSKEIFKNMFIGGGGGWVGGRVRNGSLNFSKTPTLSYIFGIWIEDVSHDLIF